MSDIAIAIHGGAGTILKSNMTPELEKAYKTVLDDAISRSYEILKTGNSAVDAVELAVQIMEDSPLFNAGKGSVFTSEGTHEMDAAIMNGADLNAGAVAAVKGIKNPISLAKSIMLNSEHILLAGNGAENFAKEHNFDFEKDEYFFDQFRYDQWQEIRHSDKFQLDHSVKDEKFGTVGAVAIDQNGDIAAATSTGGMTNKKYGRVGDSPLIGTGTYANNNTCAVSCTGSGEFFIKQVVAYDVSCLIEHKQFSLEKACDEVINHRLKNINGDGGLVAVDKHANLSLSFNTEGMYRAYIDKNENKEVSIYK